MSGQYFWQLQSFSCTCSRCMLTEVANVVELTQMRHIQGRSSNTFLSKLSLAVQLNPGIPSHLGAHWVPKTSKRQQGNTRAFQHICGYLQSHQIQNQSVHRTILVMSFPSPGQEKKSPGFLLPTYYGRMWNYHVIKPPQSLKDVHPCPLALRPKGPQGPNIKLSLPNRDPRPLCFNWKRLV